MFKVLINKKEVICADLELIINFNALARQVNLTITDINNFVSVNSYDEITVKYNNLLLLVGWVEVFSFDKIKQTIKIQGRCKSSSLIKSTMRVISRAKGYSFLGLCREITELPVKNLSNTNLTTKNLIQSTLGQGLGDFLNDVAKQLNVFLQSDGAGGLQINSYANVLQKKPTIITEEPILWLEEFDSTDLFKRITKIGSTEDNRQIIEGQAINKDNIPSNIFKVSSCDGAKNTIKDARSLAEQELALAKALAKKTTTTLPFKEKVYLAGDLIVFKNIVYFLEKVSYNFNNINASVELELIDKEAYAIG